MRTDPVREEAPPIDLESFVTPGPPLLLMVSVGMLSTPELESLAWGFPPVFCSGKKFLIKACSAIDDYLAKTVSVFKN